MKFLAEIFKRIFPTPDVIDHSRRRTAPERMSHHWLYTALCAAAIVSAFWQYGHPELTMWLLIFLVPFSFLAYVPYRIIPSWYRFTFQVLLVLVIGSWITYRLANGVTVDKTLIEALGISCLVFIMGQNSRDYEYIFALSMIMLFYGALLPRNIYITSMLVAVILTLMLLFNNRVGQLGGAYWLRNPKRIIRRNWHFRLFHIVLALFLFFVFFSLFPTTPSSSFGMFEVGFYNDKESILPPNMIQWVRSDQTSKTGKGTLISEGQQPELFGQSSFLLRIRSRASSSAKGSGGGAPPGENLIMRVRSLLKLYHLGQLYDVYDGEIWKSSKEMRESKVEPISIDGLGPEVVSSRYEIQNWMSPKLFAPFRPVTYEISSGKGGTIKVESIFYGAEIKDKERPTLPFNYDVKSQMNSSLRIFLTQEELAKISFWDESLPAEHYLQLPEGKISERLKSLVERLTKLSSSDYEKALILRDYLRNSFKYVQFAGTVPEDKETVDFFVFELKEGHCEYFASSLAIMARLAGLPSRVATGFSPGNYNTMMNCFEVYEYHAHAWTQIYVDGYGWLTMDASPPGSVESRTTPIGLGQLRDPFGNEWRVTPPEMTTHTMTTIQNMFLRRQKMDLAHAENIDKVLSQLEKVQDELREQAKKVYNKVAPEKKKGKNRPKSLREMLDHYSEKLIVFVKGNYEKIIAVMVVLAIWFYFVKFFIKFRGRIGLRERIRLNLRKSLNLFNKEDYKGSVKAAYESTRLLLIQGQFPRKKNEELLDYAKRVGKDIAGAELLLSAVFLSYYAAEYCSGPSSRRNARTSFRAALNLRRLFYLYRLDKNKDYGERVDKE